MKRQGWQTLGCCLLLLSAVGCGFQLRGLAPVSVNLAGITVASNQPYSLLTDQLTMRLASSSANKSANPYHLTVTESKPTAQEIGISSSTLIRQIQIRYRIEFTVTDASGEIVMPSSRLVATRTTYVNSNELLAGLAQEETLQAEMRTELIQLLLQRLQALPKSQGSTECRRVGKALACPPLNRGHAVALPTLHTRTAAGASPTDKS